MEIINIKALDSYKVRIDYENGTYFEYDFSGKEEGASETSNM